MDLAPTDAQLAIQQESRRFLEAEITRERRLTWDRTPEGHDAEFWRAVGQLGWFGLRACRRRWAGRAPRCSIWACSSRNAGVPWRPSASSRPSPAASRSTPSAPRRSVARGSPPWRAASG